MRRLPATSLPLSMSVLILSMLIGSTLSFAAAPDRIAGPVASAQTVALAKSLPRKAQVQYDMGPVEPSRQFEYVTLVISPSASQQQALQLLLAQQQDPKSANYHKWLTPQQYADRFGLGQNDLNKIIAWLNSQGLQVLNVGGGHNSIAFSGNAAEVQHAFGTEIHNYKVDRKVHFANSTPLMIPSAFNGVVTGVIGLHSFGPRPANQRRGGSGAGNPRRNYYDANYLFPNFLAPGDIGTIYDINPLYNAATPIDGTGQTLAIIGQTDIYMADIADFRSGFGLNAISGCTVNGSGVVTACSSTNFKYVAVGTDPGTPYSCGDLSEADLDIEWSGATARNAQVIFVNAPLVYDSNCNVQSGGGVNAALIAAIDPSSGPVIAPVVSMSYGICEAEAEDLETYLVQGNAEGVTIMNSSGDQGAAGCDFGPPNESQPFSPAVNGLAVSYPASSPEVTGVGGTGISLANDSYPTPSPYWTTPNPNPTNGGTAVSYIPELAWNDDAEFAQFCQADSSNLFCSQGGNPATPGWVPLTASATAAQVQEDIWISAGGGGASNCFTETGGGVCEAGFPQPTWQQGLSVPSAPASVRYVPDISLLASPDFPGYVFCTPLSELGEGGSASTCAGGIFDAVDTYASLIGGTSVSSPIFAGIVTLLNQYLIKSGVQSAPGLGNINPNLYQAAATNPSAFHQVKTGDNMVYCEPGTPAGQPTGILCPAGGVFGFEASNADSNTGYNLVTGLGSVDVNELATVWESSKTVLSVTITAAPTSILYGQSVLLTATVASSSTTGTATGSVTFLNGSTTLGTGTLNSSGVATLSTTALPVGADSITATYEGDLYNQPSTTATPAVVHVTAPTFTWTTTSTSHTVLAGQTTLAYNFTATPTSDSATFSSAVTFSCSFTPSNDTTLTNSSCSFTPSTIAAGTAGAIPVTMTITTAGPNTGTGTELRHRADKRSPWLPLTLPIAGLMMLGVMRGKEGRRASKRLAIALLCLSLVVLGVMIACGGSSSPPPPVTVTVAPATASLYANEPGNAWPAAATQQQFSATVNNSTSQTVTWAVTGTSANGSISSAGLYSAPTTVPNPAAITVSATSSAATTPGSGTVNILTPTGNGALPAQYTVTVTATESTTAHSVPITLTVQ
jgi:subtilase family serine protease